MGDALARIRSVEDRVTNADALDAIMVVAAIGFWWIVMYAPIPGGGDDDAP